MNRKLRILTAVLLVVIAGFPVIFTLYKEGRFSPAPTVTTVSNVTDENAETLTFAADYGFEPYSFLDEEGNPSGLDVEIATEIANRMHKKVRLLFGNWQECKARIQSGEADVLLGLEIFADESKTSTLKTLPVSHDAIRVYGREKIKDAGSLYQKKVGVAVGSIITTLFDLNCEYVEYFSYSDLLKAVDSGEVDFGICHASPAEKIIERNHLKVVPSFTLMESFLAMGIRETAPELETPVNTVIKQMADDGTLNRLYDKWIAMNVENKTLSAVVESNMAVYVAYIVFAAVACSALLFTHMQLKARKRELDTALSYQKVLETEKQRAEAASRAKSNFLSNMSHDIRTPMNAVIGFNEIAIRHIDDREKTLDALNKVRDASVHMMQIINDILDMSRIENGRMEISEKPIDVRKTFSGTEQMFRFGMEQKGITFTAEDESTVPYVYGDELRITQVIANLLSNAMKFTGPGGSVLYRCVELPDAQPGTVHYEIRIRDTGIGMSREFQRNLFQPFERERTATESRIQGTGLGLSISKNLTELMGGTLTCSSAPGRGTEFVFSLTLRIAPDAAEADAAPVPGDSVETAPSELSGRCLLLVEDNRLNRLIARNLLMDAGCVVEEAENGAEAVRMVNAAGTGHYDLILMDIQMPVMDGCQAAREIRAMEDPALAGIPIAAMTANAFDEDREKALAAGMNGYITKPIDVDEMMKVVGRLMRNYHE